MKQIKTKADFLIEIAYEIVNPLGGVYTVLATKAKEINNYYKGKYFTVGPYYQRYASVEFEEQTPIPEIARIFEELKKEGIICHYGSWLIEGKPKTFLVDFSRRLKKIRQIRKDMSKDCSVDLNLIKLNKHMGPNYHLKNPKDMGVLLTWGDSTNRLIKKLLDSNMFKKKKGVLQFHTDTGKPIFSLIKDLNKGNFNVGLVTTYHSTRLGRTIALNKENLYSEMNKFKNVGKKREYDYGGITVPGHQFEKLGAKYTDVLTAVSEITGKETRYILGRRPDIITPNGLDMGKFPSLEERAILHNKSKERIYRFLNAYFLPHYSVDMPHSLLFFTSGRYELTTKGYDLLFEALAKLNEMLKKEDYPNNIFVFLFVLTSVKDSNEEILQNLTTYDVIEHAVREELPHVEKRIISSLIHGKEIKKEILFDEHFLIESKKLMLKFKKGKFEKPPISAYKGLKEDDPILKILLNCGLDNREDDKVKVIFYPSPVSVTDGLLSMEYDEIIRGMHLGIFPSIYEPWGYTPLEAAAHGVMAITSDVAGFGKFILKNSDQRKKPGILVLKTENVKREKIINELVDMMYRVSKLPKGKRIEKKLEAKKLSTLADWKKFSKYYIQAYNLAIERLNKRQKIKKK
tara:strand:+ start:7312 stop:9201 length:1890 start_codon:yes stop_codon:yes gene_type:complete